MADFDYKQRKTTLEWDKNYEAIFRKKDKGEEEHEDTEPGAEEIGRV